MFLYSLCKFRGPRVIKSRKKVFKPYRKIINNMITIKTIRELITVKPVIPELIDRELDHGEKMITVYGINKLLVRVEYRDKALYVEYRGLPINGKPMVFSQVMTINDILIKELLARGIYLYLRRNSRRITHRTLKDRGMTLWVIELRKLKIMDLTLYATIITINARDRRGNLANGKMIIAVSAVKVPFSKSLDKVLREIERWINA